jgi:hypothetical protein
LTSAAHELLLQLQSSAVDIPTCKCFMWSAFWLALGENRQVTMRLTMRPSKAVHRHQALSARVRYVAGARYVAYTRVRNFRCCGVPHRKTRKNGLVLLTRMELLYIYKLNQNAAQSHDKWPAGRRGAPVAVWPTVTTATGCSNGWVSFIAGTVQMPMRSCFPVRPLS